MRGEIKFNKIYVATSRELITDTVSLCFLAWLRQKGEPVYVYLSLIPISLSKGVKSRRVSVKRAREMLREEFSKVTLAYSSESNFLYLIFKDLLSVESVESWQDHKYM
ncbi:MAG: hypothetical protein MPF33_05480 [Candidatus Aramenus sp.]|jgi:hypothetical protein|nr:hypothetical protein [Candidatus Aramenus sp.]